MGSKNVDTQSEKKRININKEGLRIVKVAAFCFAIVSFIATAKGLATYVFEYSWQAYLISFGVQSILFVFNLKLPFYYNRIGNNDSKKLMAGSYKKRRRVSFMQIVISVFYISILISSSWFSYVFIVNVAYANTQYVDANIVLDRSFREILGKTENYVNESIKIRQLTTIDILAELQTKIEDDENSLSKSELQGKIIDARQALQDAQADLAAAQSKQGSAQTTFEESNEERWRGNDDRAQEREEYDEGSDTVASVQKEVNRAQAELDKLENTNISSESIAKSFLQEMLKPNPSLNDYKIEDKTYSGLNSYVNTLNEYVIQSGNTEIKSSNYADIVINAEKLGISVKNYIILRQIQNKDEAKEVEEEKDVYDLNDLNDLVNTKTVDYPIIGSDDFDNQLIKWKSEWKQRYTSLEQVVKRVPEYIDSREDYIDNYKTIIDFTVLNSFDKQSITRGIDDLIRNNISTINQMERAYNLLSCTYPFLAWFSLVLACFLDLSSLLAGLFIYYVKKKGKPSLQ